MTLIEALRGLAKGIHRAIARSQSILISSPTDCVCTMPPNGVE